MKNKVVLIAVSFALFILSCNDMEKSSVDKPMAAKKEKERSKFTKPANKKKKNKPAIINEAKEETPSEATGENENTKSVSPENTAIINVLSGKVINYALQNDLSTDYCFFVDMSLPSGRNRFFIYDLKRNSISYAGLVAHGSCNQSFLSRPRFSNESKGGCSSLGKYKVGEFYRGKYGKSYRLYGLDNCNSNAYKRAVVIHGYDCVPDEEIYPRVLCNSLGCAMVSYKFFDRISRIIAKSQKPILLWVYQ